MGMKLKRDDNVIVISGKDKGKTGKVIRVEPSNDRVYVEGGEGRQVLFVDDRGRARAVPPAGTRSR